MRPVHALVLVVLCSSFFAAGQNDSSWKAWGDRLYEQGDFRGALEGYSKIPNPDVETLYRMSRACDKLGDAGDRKKYLDRAINIDPSIVRRHESDRRDLIDIGGEPRANEDRNISPITWNFETGDCMGWTRKGSAFENQPLCEDASPPSPGEQNHQGRCWIGGHANSSGSSPAPTGAVQGDGATGEMISLPFLIQGNIISFLLGGGHNCSVDLVVEGRTALSAQGKDSETMSRVYWNVSAFRRKLAQMKLVDNSSDAGDHIDFDDVRFDLHPIGECSPP